MVTRSQVSGCSQHPRIWQACRILTSDRLAISLHTFTIRRPQARVLVAPFGHASSHLAGGITLSFAVVYNESPTIWCLDYDP